MSTSPRTSFVRLKDAFDALLHADKDAFAYYVTQQMADRYSKPTATVDVVVRLMTTDGQEHQGKDAMVELWKQVIDQLDTSSRLAACEAAICSAETYDNEGCVAMLCPAAVKVRHILLTTPYLLKLPPIATQIATKEISAAFKEDKKSGSYVDKAKEHGKMDVSLTDSKKRTASLCPFLFTLIGLISMSADLVVKLDAKKNKPLNASSFLSSGERPAGGSIQNMCGKHSASSVLTAKVDNHQWFADMIIQFIAHSRSGGHVSRIYSSIYLS